MNHEENGIQRAIVEHLRLRGKPQCIWFHPFNKAASPREGAMAKAMGVRAGVSDLILVRGGKPYALELKAEGGRLSEKQGEFIDNWRDAGGFACVVEGLERALSTLTTWGFL